MKINVIKNEYVFTPRFGGNLEQTEKDQFKVVLRKISENLEANKYVTYTRNVKENKAEISEIHMDKYYRLHVKEFINPPILENENGETEELTPELLFSNKYSGLEDLIDEINFEIEKLREKRIETKKS